MNFRPLHDRVLVRRVDAIKTTQYGIIIPDTAMEKPSEGEVLAIGKGRTERGILVPIDIQIGDRVLFGKWSGSEITIEGEKLLIMNETDIMGVLEDSAEGSTGDTVASDHDGFTVDHSKYE